MAVETIHMSHLPSTSNMTCKEHTTYLGKEILNHLFQAK